VNIQQIEFEISEFLKAKEIERKTSYPQENPPQDLEFKGKDNFVNQKDNIVPSSDKIVLSYSIHKDLHKELSIEPAQTTNSTYEQIEPIDLVMSAEFEKVCKLAGCKAEPANLFEMFAGHHISRMTSAKSLVQWLGEWRKWCAREKSYQRAEPEQKAKAKKIEPLDGWIVKKWGE
jgi:hypothetical protein